MSRSGSVLFHPKNIGPVKIMNRFMRSATWDGFGDSNGFPEDEHFEMMIYLAQGMVGLICPSDVEVDNKYIRARKYGINKPEYVEAWKGVIESIHTRGNKVMFQLNHIGPERPTQLAPDQSELTNGQIEEYIDHYVQSALKSFEAGCDGIQLHGAHGFFLSNFLSPARNKRTDRWGGSTENRARIIKEIASEIRKKLGDNQEYFLSLKMNGSDIDPQGLTPSLAGELVHELNGSIDMFEISCNVTTPYHQIASDFNKAALVKDVPKEKHEEALQNARKLLDGVKFTEEFNKPYLEVIRKMNPDATLALVGGNRQFDKMEKLVKSGLADFVSISRPLLKNPFLIKEMYEGKASKSDCINCGSCLINSDYGGVYCRVNKERIW
ncbi:oxidoreductase, FAD/FMN-binding family protein [Tritrichomonas foetus]|uniref:Oxidoreductase, FAD/FMN-binding family protein n=1 Tax=Tritrichomonas foetus TaxID=1144522 RepID=A0A1J4KKN5_9EUKA|nr:oxidoreductase, FAD/FMN-binding family protein [Tritrichomonas foetus]|eukprot:OHT11496.1 oxidoreductase, FAD/FMN-binding family protein [Tritrichomonas foetus]